MSVGALLCEVGLDDDSTSRSTAPTFRPPARHPPVRMVSDFPPGFFTRADDGDDARFYGPPRFVTHIDDGAIAAVGALYEELHITTAPCST